MSNKINDIQINSEDLRLRPSAIDGFFGCAWQWGKHHLEGVSSIPSTRAAIGTSVHAAAEAMWTESIAKKDKVINMSSMLDAGMEALKLEEERGLVYEEGESNNAAAAEIIQGTEAFVDDIVPFASIPVAVEEFFKVDINHPIVKEIGGTVDYIGKNDISDLKTSKRKPIVQSHTTQQSIYKYLAEANGHVIKHNTIQAVVFKKAGAEGMILPMEANVPQAKDLVNIILDTLDVVLLDVAPIATILRPNPKYMFCSPRFCKFYGKCPATANS